ncbi:MAG: sugar phosphate isomerase/epimerase [Candidatus Poribacteria bacterium]|nr:sugar phosphate isomerase/epimerase [Candidatus Poribacteria bacterium]
MKYSFMTFSTPNLSLDENLALAKKHGWDGIEPRTVSKHGHGVEFDASPAKRNEIRAKAEDAGVALCCIATSCRYADPATVAEHVETTKRALDLAADVGSPSLRVFGGKVGDGLSREDAINLVADSLSSVAEQAAARDVNITLETHDDWCDPNHVAAVLKKVNHPKIGANWDIWHPVRHKYATLAESFEILKPWIKHLHIHDIELSSGKQVAMGAGDLDHKEVIALLKTIDFDGYLSGEWIGWDDPWETHIPREIKILRQYESELR